MKVLGISMVIAFVIGIYDGFYGPGTGTFLLLLLTAFAHMKLSEANGVAKIINLTTNITTLVVYASNAKVLVPLGITAGLFSMTGNYLGSRFFEKSGAKAAKPIMLVVLTIFCIRIIGELFF